MVMGLRAQIKTSESADLYCLDIFSSTNSTDSPKSVTYSYTSHVQQKGPCVSSKANALQRKEWIWQEARRKENFTISIEDHFFPQYVTGF